MFLVAGSGSVLIFYGSGSVSFYQQAKQVRKTLISTILKVTSFLPLKTTNVNVPVPLESNKQTKNLN
jgi:hypothetical protein